MLDNSKITKKEFKNIMTSHKSYFIGVTHQVVGEDELLGVLNNIRNVDRSKYRIGKEYSTGIQFSNKEGSSYLELADNGPTKILVFKLTGYPVYIVEQSYDDFSNSFYFKYMYYFVYMG